MPPDTGKRAPPQPQPNRPVLDLPTPEGRKAELTLVAGYIPRWFTSSQKVAHSSGNHLIASRPGVKPTTSRSQVQRSSLTLLSYQAIGNILDAVHKKKALPCTFILPVSRIHKPNTNLPLKLFQGLQLTTLCLS